eukprot:SAG22_NODE_5047_length_1101_cov_0.966068_2_plen_122_part_01
MRFRSHRLAAAEAESAGLAHAAAGEWLAAVASTTEALELANLRVVDVRRVYMQRAAAELNLWEWSAAERDFTAAIEVNAALVGEGGAGGAAVDAWPLHGRGQARAELGADRHGAASDLKQAI